MTVTTLARRRSVTRRAVVAWAIAVGCLVICLASLGVWIAIGEGLQPDAVLYVVMPLVFGGVGALLAVRVPENPIGPLLLAAIVGVTVLMGGQAWVMLGLLLEQPLPGTALAAVAAGLAFIPSIVLVLVGIPLIFPTGRFLGPRWRWVAVAVAVAVIAAEMRLLFGEPYLMEIETMPNPLFRPAWQATLEQLDQLAALSAIPLFALTVVSVVLRYRRGPTIERLQLRWLFAVSTVAIVAFAISFNMTDDARGVAELIGLAAIAAYPIAIGVAIARYHLYDIDRLISRSIAYALITAVLVGTYALAVVILQGPLGGLVGDDTVVVALSTLVVASLFQPVRRRIQGWVDHRFDRARVDAERTAGQFASRLRDEVDIEAVLADLSATVDAALRPARASLWLRDGER